jgi:hypothetical protein
VKGTAATVERWVPSTNAHGQSHFYYIYHAGLTDKHRRPHDRLRRVHGVCSNDNNKSLSSFHSSLTLTLFLISTLAPEKRTADDQAIGVKSILGKYSKHWARFRATAREKRTQPVDVCQHIDGSCETHHLAALLEVLSDRQRMMSGVLNRCPGS